MNQNKNHFACRKMRLPVAFHRWFEDGAGWGCDDSIIERLTEIVRTTKNLIQAEERDEIFDIPIDQGILIGVIERDENCPDTKAQARHPFILKACVVTTSDVSRIDSKDGNWKNVVLEALLDFNVPRVRPNGGLYSVLVPEKPAETLQTKFAEVSSTERQLAKKVMSMNEEIQEMRRLLNRLRNEVDELRYQRGRPGKDTEFPEYLNYDTSPKTSARPGASRALTPYGFSGTAESYRVRRAETSPEDQSLIPGGWTGWLLLLSLAAVMAYLLLH